MDIAAEVALFREVQFITVEQGMGDDVLRPGLTMTGSHITLLLLQGRLPIAVVQAPPSPQQSWRMPTLAKSAWTTTEGTTTSNRATTAETMRGIVARMTKRREVRGRWIE
jgi:hypothetical protein